MKRGTILCIHQSAELYGSDRSFLDAVAGLVERDWDAVVCLAETGPLWAALEAVGARVVREPLTKLARSSLSPLALPALFASLVRAHLRLVSLARSCRAVAVYSNTIAVIDGAFVASRLSLPHIWHVRELIERPKPVAWLFKSLVKRFSDLVITNSGETRRWLTDGKRWSIPVEVVWNGIALPCERKPDPEAVARARANLEVPAGRKVVLLAGRINEWKGHGLLLEAVASLPETLRNRLLVVFAGDVSTGKDHLREALRARVTELALEPQVRFLGFVPDMSRVYPAVDLSVVPSILPEPFGRTAVESLAWGVPVIAAAHGGLKEIVLDGQVGWLFKPGDAGHLARLLETALTDSVAMDPLRDAAIRRASECFSLIAYRERIATLVGGRVVDRSDVVSGLPTESP